VCRGIEALSGNSCYVVVWRYEFGGEGNGRVN